jgi:DNA-binding MarR family transcriptional regulator
MSPALHDALTSPVRLRIAGYLSGCEEADFKAVAAYCRLTSPNLSKQITTLSEAGLLAITKVPSGRYTTTRLRLTDTGRAALDSHINALQEIASAARTQHPTGVGPAR